MGGSTKRLEGKVALVTGASKGIGRQAAERLAGDGAAVAVNYLSDERRAQEVVEAIERGGGQAIACRADVSNQNQVKEMVDEVIRRFGHIDILVNNAAIFPWRPWTEVAEDEWDRVFAVNLKGCLWCARACYPSMKSRGWGRIISMSSATFLHGDPNLLAYACSKGGIVALTRSLAQAMGDDGITVNAVTTGRTLTDGLKRWFEEGVLDYEETVRSRQAQCIKRLATPADIVGAIAFLASDDAAYITGQLINVDGGRIMY